MPFLPLVHHPDTPAPWVQALEVAWAWEADGGLALRYRLRGDLARLALPGPAPAVRRDGLWRHTCFELFASAAAPAYLEYNFSPSGAWQAYAFRDYRQGGPLEPALAPGLELETQAHGLTLAARLAPAALPRGGPPRLGLTAVLEAADGGLSYWALRHAPGKPDFHHPDTFALEPDPRKP